MDALEVASGRAGFTLARALDNYALCQDFVGLLARTIYMAHEMGKNIFKVRIGVPYVSESATEGFQIRADLSFPEDGAVADSLNFLDRVDGMKEFVGKKSDNLGKVLAKNPSYLVFLQKVVELMETRALKQGVRFSELNIVKTFITADNSKIVMVLS